MAGSMKIPVGRAVRCTSDYMQGWTGIVVGHRWCKREGCYDKECTYVVEWTVPRNGEKCSMSHKENIYEIPPLVFLAEQAL